VASSEPGEAAGLRVRHGTTGDAREPFSVKFYLVAMVFILFDVEAIFLYPWAYIFRSLRWYGFAEMMIYIAILLVGYLYLWKRARWTA